jgi:spore coat protein CotH
MKRGEKKIDRLAVAAITISLVFALVLSTGYTFGIQASTKIGKYAEKLFDNSEVHSINIIMDDWDEFIENATSEEYYTCSLVIDNELIKNVAIRAKGNTSLTQVAQYGNNRYSFKIEFDHYQKGKNYYGLDKLCLNNIIQDNTYMKDYIAYTMMNEFGVDSPLCSFAYIQVNGEDFGLYLAVEGIEDAFETRNGYTETTDIYKPDSQNTQANEQKALEGNFVAEGSMSQFTQNSDTENTDSTADQNSDSNSDQNVSEDVQTADNQNTQNGQNDMQNFDPSQNGTVQMPSNGEGNFQSDGQNGQMPAIPEGTEGFEGMDSNSEPPAKPDGETEASDQIPSDVPDDMPEIPEGGMDSNGGFGGGMEKPDGQGGGNDMVQGSSDVMLQYVDDDPDSYSNIFDNAKTDVTDSEKSRLIETLQKLSNNEDLDEILNTDEIIRYFVVHNFMLNYDSYTGSMIHNYYLIDKDGVLSMVPWDYNLSFGGFQSMSSTTELVNTSIDDPISSGTLESRPMLNWIFENEEYLAKYHELYSRWISEMFESGYFEQWISDTYEMILPYVEKDPTKFCTTEEFETGVSTLLEFCSARAESIRNQLDTLSVSTDSVSDYEYVDASDLVVSDMGSMQNDQGGMGKDQGGIGQMQKPDENVGFGGNNPFDQNQNGDTSGDQENTGDQTAQDQTQNAVDDSSGTETDQTQPDSTQPEMPSDSGGMEMPDNGGAGGDMQMPDGMQGDFDPGQGGEMPDMQNMQMPDGTQAQGQMPADGQMPSAADGSGQMPDMNQTDPNAQGKEENSSDQSVQQPADSSNDSSDSSSISDQQTSGDQSTGDTNSQPDMNGQNFDPGSQNGMQMPDQNGGMENGPQDDTASQTTYWQVTGASAITLLLALGIAFIVKRF